MNIINFMDCIYYISELWHVDYKSLGAQMVKSLPAMQETWVLSLGWEDPLKKETATHSNILAWRAPRTEQPGGVAKNRT